MLSHAESRRFASPPQLKISDPDGLSRPLLSAWQGHTVSDTGYGRESHHVRNGPRRRDDRQRTRSLIQTMDRRNGPSLSLVPVSPYTQPWPCHHHIDIMQSRYMTSILGQNKNSRLSKHHLQRAKSRFWITGSMLNLPKLFILRLEFKLLLFSYSDIFQ